MISVISPAKTLDMSPLEHHNESQIRFPKETMSLVRSLKKLKPENLIDLMHISEQLAILNSDRYKHFSKEFDATNSKQALWAFNGGVYLGLGAEDFTIQEQDFAQQHLRMLSGLYGLLRPNDMMQAYRLEMGTKLSIRKHGNLYQYWANKITNLLQKDIDESGSNVLINLASQEYFKSVNTKKIKAEVINIHFKEYRNDQLKIISFNAKKARGLMSRYIVKNNITDHHELKGFNYENYYFDDKLSNSRDWLFIK